MRWIGIALVLLAITFYGAKSYYSLSDFDGTSSQRVEQDYHFLSNEIRQHDQNKTTPFEGVDRLREMRREKTALWIEWKRRSWSLDQAMPVAIGLGVVLCFLPSVWTRWRKRRKSPKRKKSRNLDDQVREAPSREEYVDEWDFHRRTEGAFHTREEAIDWLLHDPLLKCDYCGGRLQSTYQGDREALQMVTFYKKVPEGARDLRIVLGSYWFALTASEIKCSSCGRTVHR